LSQAGAAQVVGKRTSEGCLSLADVNTKVTATGRLSVGTFTDDYGTERAFILKLPRAICIDDGGEFANPSERFSELHVSAVNGKLLRGLRRSVGKRITVSGEGFAAHTRHHHRPLVMLADRITVR
jgi:hypothetical protein